MIHIASSGKVTPHLRLQRSNISVALEIQVLRVSPSAAFSLKTAVHFAHLVTGLLLGKPLVQHLKELGLSVLHMVLAGFHVFDTF